MSYSEKTKIVVQYVYMYLSCLSLCNVFYQDKCQQSNQPCCFLLLICYMFYNFKHQKRKSTLDLFLSLPVKQREVINFAKGGNLIASLCKIGYFPHRHFYCTNFGTFTAVHFRISFASHLKGHLLFNHNFLHRPQLSHIKIGPQCRMFS